MQTTLDLDRRTRGAPRRSGLVIVDVRHDLAQPDSLGRDAVPFGPHSRRPLRCISTATSRRRRPAPTAAIRCRRPRRPPATLRAPRHRPRHAGGRLRPAAGNVRGAPVVDAALARSRRRRGAGRRLREVAPRGPSGDHRRAARRADRVPDPPRSPRTVDAPRCSRACADALARRRRRALARALPRRSRAAGSGRRPHPRRRSTARPRRT